LHFIIIIFLRNKKSPLHFRLLVGVRGAVHPKIIIKYASKRARCTYLINHLLRFIIDIFNNITLLPSS